jgi:hypothetical protein
MEARLQRRIAAAARRPDILIEYETAAEAIDARSDELTGELPPLGTSRSGVPPNHPQRISNDARAALDGKVAHLCAVALTPQLR